MEGQVYRGGGGAASGGSLSGSAYNQLDTRIGQLEQQMRDLTGQIEKAVFAAQQVQQKLDHIQADNEVRFKELEQKGEGAPAAANSPAGAIPLTPPKGSLEKNDEPATVSTVGGSLVHSGNAPAAPALAAPAPAVPALQGKTPQEQYTYAFDLLRNSQYDAANKAFAAFVAQHPQDSLAGNAMFWMGQIPYSQGQYDQAAQLFLEAYRKYPKSAKAGESLLRVGQSMNALGKKKEACAALSRFMSEFSDAADNLRRQAGAEKQKAGC